MTVSSTERTAGPFTRNGTQVDYPFTFRVFADTDVLATQTTVAGIVNPLVLGSDYTVAVNADQRTSPGGTLTMLDAGGVVGETLDFTTNLQATQGARITNAGGFYAEIVENALDKLTVLMQQLGVFGNQGLRAPFPEVLDVLPSWPDRLGLQLLFHPTTGQPYLAAPVSGSAADVMVQLADTSSGLKNAGLVGLGPSLIYADQTTGSAIQSQGVTPSMFSYLGAVDPTGAADSTIAIKAWAASPHPKIGEPGRYKVTETVTFPVNEPIDYRGMILDGSAGGTWTSAAVALWAGSISALPALSANVVRDQQVIATATAHGLDEGDVFCIYNPTDSSWSSIRTYYRAGEYCKVGRVTSTVGMVLTKPLYADYLTADVDLYKLARAEVDISNLTVIGPAAAAVVGVKPSLCTRVRMRNVNVWDGNYCGIYPDRCVDVELHGCNVLISATAVTDAYGLLIGNSQDVRVFGGMLHSKRAGFDVGGDDFTCAVPSRNVQIFGATISNEMASNFPALDLHGNLEGFKATACHIVGGASWAGVDNEYVDCTFADAPAGVGALIVGGSEWLGGTARVTGGKMRATGVFSTEGVVRIVTNAAAKQDTSLIVENVEADIGPNTIFVKTEMATSSFLSSAKVTDITFSSAASMAQILRCQGTGAAGEGSWAIVDRISGAPAGALLYYTANGYGAATPARLMMQRGISSVTSVSAAASSSTNTTFGYSYGSKIPSVNCSQQTRLVGSQVIAAMPRSVNASAFQSDIYTTSGAAFGAVAAVDVSWSAGVSEV